MIWQEDPEAGRVESGTGAGSCAKTGTQDGAKATGANSKRSLFKNFPLLVILAKLKLDARWDGVAKYSGGWGGIRTHGGLAPTAVFKTAALNHSATHPVGAT